MHEVMHQVWEPLYTYGNYSKSVFQWIQHTKRTKPLLYISWNLSREQFLLKKRFTKSLEKAFLPTLDSKTLLCFFPLFALADHCIIFSALSGDKILMLGFNVSSSAMLFVHCNEKGNEQDTAVPFAWMVSGYYMAIKSGKGEGIVRRVHSYSSTHLTFCLETQKQSWAAKGVWASVRAVDDSNIVPILHTIENMLSYTQLWKNMTLGLFAHSVARESIIAHHHSKFMIFVKAPPHPLKNV